MKQLRKTKPVLQDRVRRIVFPKRPVHRSQEIKVLLNLEPTGIKSDIFICIVRFKTAHTYSLQLVAESRDCKPARATLNMSLA